MRSGDRGRVGRVELPSLSRRPWQTCSQKLRSARSVLPTRKPVVPTGKPVVRQMLPATTVSTSSPSFSIQRKRRRSSLVTPPSGKQGAATFNHVSPRGEMVGGFGSSFSSGPSLPENSPNNLRIRSAATLTARGVVLRPVTASPMPPGHSLINPKRLVIGVSKSKMRLELSR